MRQLPPTPQRPPGRQQARAKSRRGKKGRARRPQGIGQTTTRRPSQRLLPRLPPALLRTRSLSPQPAGAAAAYLQLCPITQMIRLQNRMARSTAAQTATASNRYASCSATPLRMGSCFLHAVRHRQEMVGISVAGNIVYVCRLRTHAIKRTRPISTSAVGTCWTCLHIA